MPLGQICGARSGDKGGDADIGVWARDEAGHAWLASFLTPQRVRELLGDGVASSPRPDTQAKGLSEYLRSRVVDVPEHLLPG